MQVTSLTQEPKLSSEMSVLVSPHLYTCTRLTQWRELANRKTNEIHTAIQVGPASFEKQYQEIFYRINQISD